MKLYCPNCDAHVEGTVRKWWLFRYCPHCETEVSKGFASPPNTSAFIQNDMSYVESCLKSYANIYSHSVTLDPDKLREFVPMGVRVWMLETPHPFLCEVEYRSDRYGSVAVNVISRKDGESVVRRKTNLEPLAVRYGLEPYSIWRWSHYPNEGDQTRYLFGVSQAITTVGLTTSLLKAVVDRMAEALKVIEVEVRAE